MASPLLAVVLVVLLVAAGCDRIGAQESPAPKPVAGPPMTSAQGDDAFARLREGCNIEQPEDDGMTYITRIELDKATRVLTIVEAKRRTGATAEELFSRDCIDLRQVDPTRIVAKREAGIMIEPYPGRQAFTREFFMEGRGSLGTTPAPSYQLPHNHDAQTYRMAAVLRELVAAAQEIPETPPGPADPVATVTALISGTHWTWYEGDFLSYKPRMRYWIDFYSDGTARVPWRDTPQAWKVAADGTLTVSDAKARDAHTFTMDVTNKSGSAPNGKLHLQYEGPVFESKRRGEAWASDADAAFADVKRLCEQSFKQDAIVEVTTLQFDKAKGVLSLQSQAAAGGPTTHTFQLTIDLRNIDPARIKPQARQVRMEPYAGKQALRGTTKGTGAFASRNFSENLPVYDLSPAEPTQCEGLADVLRELVTAVQKSPAL